MLEVFDDLIDDENQKKIIHSVLRNPFFWGERDSSDTPPTGLVSNFGEEHLLYKSLVSTIRKKCNLGKNELYRSYINCFSPGERP
jgi:hypothetical protein